MPKFTGTIPKTTPAWCKVKTCSDGIPTNLQNVYVCHDCQHIKK